MTSAVLDPHSATLICSGEWILPRAAKIETDLRACAWPRGKLTVNASGIERLDTSGAWLLHRTLKTLRLAGQEIELHGMKAEFSGLMEMIAARDAETKAAQQTTYPLMETLGRALFRHWKEAVGMLTFIGEAAIAALRLIAHPARIRIRPILHNIQGTGFDALPIVGLLSFLMGMVVSYQGASQLERYGASIFVADLVGLSMLREMGPLLTAIIVAGRSGSAFTAQIGTMKVTEEIDAMRTIGIPPMDLLVLPKILALMLVLPLLTVYADIMGVLGGMVLAKAKLGIPFEDFLDRFDSAIRLASLMVGVGKALMFALIVALVGCFQGFRVSGSADSVGHQTTVSVVQAIFLIIVVDAVFSIIFSWLNI